MSGTFTKDEWHGCVADALALLTIVVHDDTPDRDVLVTALDIIKPLGDGGAETLDHYVNRLAVLVAAQASISAGFVMHAADLSGATVDQIVQGVALRNELRKTGGAS